MWWLRVDGEQFVGEQEYYYEQDQQDQCDKASIAWDNPCFLITLITQIILHVSP